MTKLIDTPKEDLLLAALDLSSSLRLEEVLDNAAQLVMRAVPCDYVRILRWDEDRSMLSVCHSRGAGFGGPAGDTWSLETGAAREVVKQGRSVRIPDHPGAELLKPDSARSGHLSIVAVPVCARGRLIGVLELGTRRVGGVSLREERDLEDLGSRMGCALENACLYEETLALRNRLSEELDCARQIQRGLMPRQAPIMDGFEIGAAFAPAHVLAGDFYDFLPLPDGRLVLVLGDVAGKDTPAALYGSLAVGIIRGHVASLDLEPADMLAHLNGHLMDIRADTRFLTLAYGVLDCDNGCLTIAAAGIPRPRLIRNGVVRSLDAKGLPLGLFESVSYREKTVCLESGDTVVLCSDGLEDDLFDFASTRTRADLDQCIGELIELPAQEMANTLMELGAAGGIANADDDRTVVVIKALSC